MSLTTKRVIAGIYLVILLFATGNRYLHWNLTPGLEKKILAVVMLIGVIWVARFGPAMLHEIEEYRAKQKQQRENEQ